MMYEAGTIAEGTFPIDSYLSIAGAVGSITFDEETADGGLLFTINATSGSEKVALNAAVVFAEDGLSINLNLDGSIESAGAMLSLTEGSFAKVNLHKAVSRATLEDDSYEGEITSGELELEVWHTPGHTDGQLAFRLGNLLFSGDNLFRDGCVGAIDAHHGSSIPDFIASLRRIRASDVEWLLPSHGPVFRKDNKQIDATITRLDQLTHDVGDATDHSSGG